MFKIIVIFFTICIACNLAADPIDLEGGKASASVGEIHDIHFDFIYPDLAEVDGEQPQRSARFGPQPGGDKVYAVAAYTRVNWFQAQQICSYQGMTLASISTASEHQNLKRHLVNNGFLSNNANFWIAGTDLGAQSQWTWFNTGRPLIYDNWAPGQPDNLNNTEHCLLMTGDGRWNDVDCEQPWFFICENRCPLESDTAPIYTTAFA